MGKKSQIIIIIILLGLLLIGCNQSDDDGSNPGPAMPVVGDVKFPEPEDFSNLAKRPCDLDGITGEEILFWTQKIVEGYLTTEFEILDLQGSSVFQSEPVVLGEGGSAQYLIAELDGAPPAEIIVTYQSFITINKQTKVTSWANVLRGPDYKPIDSIAPIEDMTIWSGPLFDLNLDGVPEWVIEMRPASADVPGKLILRDFVSNEDLLTIETKPGQQAQIFGQIQPDGIMAPALIDGMDSKNRFLVTISDLFDNYHVELSARTTDEPNLSGEVLQEVDLTLASGFDVDLVDHDKDGFSDILTVFYTDTGPSYSFGEIYQGVMTDCLFAKADVAPDIDGDAVGDLIVTANGCGNSKGEQGSLRVHFSSMPDSPFELETTGVGKLQGYWHEPRPGEISEGDGPDNSNNKLAVLVEDESATNMVELFLTDESDPFFRVWDSGEMAQQGTPVLSDAHIADYTGDGVLDIVANSVVWFTELNNVVYKTKTFLFEGPDLNDIYPFEPVREFRSLGILWDFNLDDNPDLLLNRSMIEFVTSPGIEIYSPSTGFETLITLSDTTAISIGIEGRIY